MAIGRRGSDGGENRTIDGPRLPWSFDRYGLRAIGVDCTAIVRSGRRAHTRHRCFLSFENRRAAEVIVESDADSIRAYVTFHATLKNAYQNFVRRLEDGAKSLVRHHLFAATSEFASLVSDTQLHESRSTTTIDRRSVTLLEDDRRQVEVRLSKCPFSFAHSFECSTGKASAIIAIVATRGHQILLDQPFNQLRQMSNERWCCREHREFVV